jgi:hypothetical protein
LQVGRDCLELLLERIGVGVVFLIAVSCWLHINILNCNFFNKLLNNHGEKL